MISRITLDRLGARNWDSVLFDFAAAGLGQAGASNADGARADALRDESDYDRRRRRLTRSRLKAEATAQPARCRTLFAWITLQPLDVPTDCSQMRHWPDSSHPDVTETQTLEALAPAKVQESPSALPKQACSSVGMGAASANAVAANRVVERMMVEANAARVLITRPFLGMGRRCGVRLRQ